MKVFIDFDDVIFNTNKFKHDLAEIFFKHGVTRNFYDETYYDPYDERMVRTYDPFSQIRRLKMVDDISGAEIIDDVENFLSDVSSYVFKDVGLFVDDFGKENVFVLSYGDIDFQNHKIDGSGIRRHIPGIFVTDTLKADMLDHVLKLISVSAREPLFFLDDRVEQINDVKEKFPRVISILIKRPEGRYQDMVKDECCDHEAHNLMEAQEIIKEMIEK